MTAPSRWCWSDEPVRGLVLASASPRRRRLLEQLGLRFEVEPAGGRGGPSCPGRDGVAHVERLALTEGPGGGRASAGRAGHRRGHGGGAGRRDPGQAGGRGEAVATLLRLQGTSTGWRRAWPWSRPDGGSGRMSWAPTSGSGDSTGAGGGVRCHRRAAGQGGRVRDPGAAPSWWSRSAATTSPSWGCPLARLVELFGELLELGSGYRYDFRESEARMSAILAIDQGTTGTTCMVVGRRPDPGPRLLRVPAALSPNPGGSSTTRRRSGT
jgi:hypothetical protein